MKTGEVDRRRRALLGLAASGAFGAAGLIGMIRRAHAMARRPVPEGMQELKGEVRINNVAATLGAVVKPGDSVTTGADSRVVFVIGEDSFLMREHTRVQVSGESVVGAGEPKTFALKTLNVFTGKVLSVFGRGDKRILTPTVTIGVRGTGVYIEAEPTRTYVCTCYGETSLESRGSSARETIRAKHHESPRFVYASGTPDAIMKAAPMINHTDDELTMLEALLGRTPPFSLETAPVAVTNAAPRRRAPEA